MKTALLLLLAAAAANLTPLPAQETAPLPPAAAEASESPAPREEASAGKDSDAERWRREVLAWKEARLVDKGAEAGAIRETNKSVLVLGTVNGDISTVAGDVAVLGVVNGNVSTVSGTVTVLGKITGNASVVGGNLRVAGEVGGEKSVVGGREEIATMEQAPEEAEDTAMSAAEDEESEDAAESEEPAPAKPEPGVKGHFRVDGGHFDLNFKHDGNVKIDGGGFIKAFWLSPFMLVWRSGLLVLWVALSCAIVAAFQPSVQRAAAELRAAPARSAAFGLLWTILFWLLLVGCVLLSFMVIGIPLLIVLVAFHLAIVAFGMTLTFSVFGDWVARKLNRPGVSIYAAVFIGACALGLLRLVPIAGSFIWLAAGLFGTGATLTARFGSAAKTTPPPTPTAALPTAPAAA